MSHFQQYRQTHNYAKDIARNNAAFDRLRTNNKMRAAQARSNATYHWVESGRASNPGHNHMNQEWKRKAVEAAAWKAAQKNANKWRGGKTRKGKKSKRSRRTRKH
jgi:hypothetical protein